MIEVIQKLMMGLAIAGVTSCSGNLPPNPLPSPSPSPTPPPEDQHQPVCSPPDLVKGCWHQPPGEDWQFIPPDPDPPSDDCTPQLSAALMPPLNGDGWLSLGTETVFASEMKAAIIAARGACSAAWSDERCLLNGPAGIDQGYLLIAKQLQVKGVRAAQAVDAQGRLYDHLFVCRDSRVCEEWKLFAFTDGCLAQSQYRGAHLAPADSAPAPPPAPPAPPPPADGCTAPLPPKLWTAETLPDGWGSDEIGKPRWVIECGPHNNVIDCTAKVAPRACEYCDAIGMGEAGGQIRCGCPVRNECPGTFKCEERAACEAYLTGGTRLEPRNGATCEIANDNPFQFRPSGGNCRLVSAGDPRVYSEWY
jgi:hypothetical protein